MDEHAAQAHASRRLELDARRNFIRVRLLQARIDRRRRSTEAAQLRPFLAALKLAVAVAIDPVIGGSAKVVLVRT